MGKKIASEKEFAARATDDHGLSANPSTQTERPCSQSSNSHRSGPIRASARAYSLLRSPTSKSKANLPVEART